jgi:hypothetical protein
MDSAAMKAYVPKALKRRAFAAFAMLDTNYSRWTREQLEKWLASNQQEGSIQTEEDCGCETSQH